jgi:diguanylate cyclase (GGDEF)-like protein
MPDSAVPATTSALRRPRSVDGVARLFVAAAVGLVLVIATVLTAVMYARDMVDNRVIEAEIRRAAMAVSLAAPGFPDAETLGHNYVLNGARVAESAEVRPNEASVPIPGISGFVLAWTPDRIGSQLFVQIAPLRLGVTALFLLGVCLVLWQMLRIARKLDEARAVAADRATRDPLTGLANRASFEERLAQLFSRESAAGLLYLDLDDFKAVNDRHGHLVGDIVLAEVARRFSHFSLGAAEVFRIGGDEFAVIVTGTRGRLALEELARDIAASMAEPISTVAGPVATGVSIGIAERGDAVTPAELIAAADAALYRAKSSGRVFDVAPSIPRAA